MPDPRDTSTVDVFAPQTRRIVAGPLGWEVFRFGLPIALGMALQVTFNLVDAYLIARLPADRAGPAIGAVGICDQIAAVGTIISYGLSTATAAILSQRKGAGDLDGVRRVGWQSLLLTLGLSILYGFVGVFGAQAIMVGLVGAKGEVARMGVEYLRVIVGGSFSIFFLLQLTSIMRALGSSKTPVAILVGGNVLNFFLAILLVYGQGERPAVFDWSLPIARALHAPRMELVGAAWATVIARSLALIPAVVWLASARGDRILKPRREWVRPQRKELAAIWKIGWPSSTQFVVRVGAFVATSALIAHAFTTEADQTASTAYGIVFRVETTALFISMGWGSAAQTFTGTCMGAGKMRRAGWAGWWAAGYDAVFMGLLAYTMALWGAPLLQFFDPTPRVVEIGREYLAAVGPSYVTYGAAIVLGNAFSGIGATRKTLRLDLIVVLLVQIPLSMLAVVFVKQRTGLWGAIATAYAASAIVYGVAYVRSREFWPRRAEEEDEQEEPDAPR
ncbi:MAG: MATE family efflux transporter [Deltaproteobacteria bacterium]|nr:MATE family efflux transporter [Deltaproteobacteria bacterium]